MAAPFQITVKAAKDNFFVAEKVLTRIKDERKKSLARVAGFVRKTARRSIRKIGKKWKSSEAGAPPKSRSGLLRQFILFLYDSTTESTLVGPARLPNKNKVEGKTIPQILEFGGTASTSDFVPTGKWKTIKGKRVPLTQRKRRKYRLKARPYMMPALNIMLKENKLVKEFENIL